MKNRDAAIALQKMNKAYEESISGSMDDRDVQKLRHLEGVRTLIVQNSAVNNQMILAAAQRMLSARENSIADRACTSNEKGVTAGWKLILREKTADALKDASITGFDWWVHEVLCNIWCRGGGDVIEFTLSQLAGEIYRGQKSNLSQKQLEEVLKSMTKLLTMSVRLDITDELKNHLIREKGKLPRMDEDGKINAPLLHGWGEPHTGKGKKSTMVYRLTGCPTLLAYNQAKGNLLTVPVEWFEMDGIPMRSDGFAIRDYLIRRITNPHMVQTKIDFKTIHSHVGYDWPDTKGRRKNVREKVVQMLALWTQKGLLKGYELVGQSTAFPGEPTGVRFFRVENAKEKKKKPKAEAP